VDHVFWQELEGLEPTSVCRRSSAVAECGGYRLQMLDQDCLVLPRERRIVRSRVGSAPCPESVAASDLVELILVHYLIHAREIPLAGEWVGLLELGSANRFFESHPPDFGPLLPLFSSSPESVVGVAQDLGGGRLEYGDLAVAFRVLPRLPIAFVYWAGGEEFTATASVLFDRTAEQHLPLDVLSAAVQETIRALAALVRSLSLDVNGKGHAHE
jgi:hypothetical protein